MKTRTKALGALATLVVAGAVATVPAVPAFAAASVSVVSELGGANADPDYATTVTVNASGFQSIKGGMGGVYVLFGWVDSGWKPSNGGQVGADYRYVPDSEAKDNAGFQRFVAFPGSSTKDSAQATMSDDGSFSVTMTIPGASFESTDRNGKVSTVNCLEVTCGIITIGAHGIKNANNETFTPITFMSGVGQAKPQTQPAAQPTAQATAAAKAPKVAARVGIAHATVTAGTSVVFTGQGFTPGEQVIVDFAQGASSVGPLVAGDAGEVAASVPVPATIRSGTHVVTLTGAASGQVAEAEVSVTGGTTPEMATPTTAEQTPVWLLVTLLSAILVAGLLLIASIVLSIVRAVRRRRARKAAAAAVVAPAVVREPAEDADTVPLDVVVGKA